MIDTTEDHSGDVGLMPIAISVIWIGCSAVGATGLLTHLAPIARRAKEAPAVVAHLIHVQLAQIPAESPAEKQSSAPPPPSAEASPPPPPAADTPPAAPPMASVAAPSAAIAFALPTSGPSRVIAAAQAVPTGPLQDHSNAARSPTVEHITYGQGEGEQPKPDYPLEAELNAEAGTVLVRYTIGVDGTVTKAEAIKPCAYPLLNQSAVRAVRETWRFRPGPIRIVETPIEYRLKQN